MFDFNKDIKKRDEIIYGEYDTEKYFGGYRRISDMSVELVKKLIDLKFIDPTETQNLSPSIQEFVDWAERHEGFVFDGYAISLDRSDYRVSIEEIHRWGDYTKEELKDFVDMFAGADEFETDGGLSAWWD